MNSEKSELFSRFWDEDDEVSGVSAEVCMLWSSSLSERTDPGGVHFGFLDYTKFK